MKQLVFVLLLIFVSGPLKAQEGTNSGTQATADDSKVFLPSDLDVQPEYPGGIEAFYKFLNMNFTPPEVDQNIDARFMVNFIIETDGSVWGIKVVKSPIQGITDEMIRVLKLLPKKWSPGMKDNKPVKTLYSFPYEIKITKS